MSSKSIRVDIVSDVVCPWCIVAYLQLERAAELVGVPLEIFWHPFELNPHMESEGENLQDHIMRKYGSSLEQSQRIREALTDLGVELGFHFSWSADSKIYNTFLAHQLLHCARETDEVHLLKMALFEAYFGRGLDVSDIGVLCNVASSIGLDAETARAALLDRRYAENVREKEAYWTTRGVAGVPTMVFDMRQATSGALGVDRFSHILKELAPRE